jgi:hypothetical protein
MNALFDGQRNGYADIALQMIVAYAVAVSSYVAADD